MIPWSTVALAGIFVAAIVVTNIFAPGTTSAIVSCILVVASALGLKSMQEKKENEK